MGLFTEPTETLLALPKGMWHMATRIGEMAVGERGSLEDPENTELLGFSSVKRQVANHFGVDVYSSNRVLQEKLNSLSWAGYAGGAAVRLATLPIGGPAGAVLTGTSFSTTVGELLRDHTPEELRHLNRDKLEIMRLDDSLIEVFLQHPWYSPRHETVLVQALFEMNIVKNRKAFFEVATSARFEEEALFFQRIAEMLLSYHQNVKPLEEFVAIDDTAVDGIDTRSHVDRHACPSSFFPWRAELAESAETVATWASAQQDQEGGIVDFRQAHASCSTVNSSQKVFTVRQRSHGLPHVSSAGKRIRPLTPVPNHSSEEESSRALLNVETQSRYR